MENPELINEYLESIFKEQLSNLNHITMQDMEPREK